MKLTRFQKKVLKNHHKIVTTTHDILEFSRRLNQDFSFFIHEIQRLDSLKDPKEYIIALKKEDLEKRERKSKQSKLKRINKKYKAYKKSIKSREKNLKKDLKELGKSRSKLARLT